MVRLSYQIQIIEALLSRNGGSGVREELEDAQEIVDDSIKEIRRVLVGLNPPDLEHLGLVEAMRREVNQLDKLGMTCRWDLVGQPVRLPSSVETAIYRIVQEALNNIQKHASATQVSLRAEFQDRQVVVELRDNGKGFDVSRTLEGALAAGRLGLWGIKQRAQALGGALNVESAPGRGTTVRLQVPIETPQLEGVSKP
jgi:two-component system sensor histidine kinase DegS